MAKLTKRSTSAQWVGVRVRAIREIETERAIFPRGTTFEVLRKFKGLTLLTISCEPPCGCLTCGIQLRARKVPFEWLEVL